MDTKTFEKTEKEHLRSYPVAFCMRCKTKENIYICMSGHEHYFCKPCLSATIKRDNNRLFAARCLKADCNFAPLIPLNKRLNG